MIIGIIVYTVCVILCLSLSLYCLIVVDKVVWLSHLLFMVGLSLIPVVNVAVAIMTSLYIFERLDVMNSLLKLDIVLWEKK